MHGALTNAGDTEADGEGSLAALDIRVYTGYY
jgi:hypothetical protein